MRITCDSCGAKYSIADEKVRGKVFKIRCKKCSNIVVVRGTAAGGGAMAAPDTAEVLPGVAGEQESADAPVWHLVIGRDQVGPLTAAQVREHLESGAIDGNSYVWREGYADWARLASVAELAALTEGGEQAAPWMDGGAGPRGREAGHGSRGAEGAGRTAGSLAPVGGAEREPSGGAFAGLGPQGVASRGGLFSAPGGAGAGGSDLFPSTSAGSAAAEPMFPGDDTSVGAVAEAMSGPRMTGQRGENSVLFSLANLQALATGGPAAGPTGGAFSATTGSASPADGGSSGLLNIRAMAAATVPAAGRRATSDDELPAYGGFAAPIAAAPVLFPTAVDERPSWLLPVLIGVGGLLLAVIAVLVVVLLRRPAVQLVPTPAQQVAVVADPGSAVPADPGTAETPDRKPQLVPATAAPAPTPAPVGGGGPAAATGVGSGGRQGGAGGRPRQVTRRPDGEPAAGGEAAAQPERDPTAATPASPTPRRPTPERGRDDLDNMIDEAITRRQGGAAKPAAGGGEAAPAGALPERLSRSQIMDTMATVKGRVQACYDRYKVPGLTNVQLKIAGSGQIQSAAVEGLFAGTETGACVESAVRGARFPAFAAPSMSIKYPFMLR
jgi:predicted Zn finger-like uncharacterized protein